MALDEATTSVRTLQAFLNYAEEGCIEITWSCGNTVWKKYNVDEKKLHACGVSVRSTLDRLQGELDWSRGTDKLPDGCDAVLAALAEAGAELYDALLTGMEGDKASEGTAAVFRSWLEDEPLSDPEGWHVHFVHSDYTQPILPWGLLHAPLGKDDAPFDARPMAPKAWNGFWCSMFRLSCSNESYKKKMAAAPKMEPVAEVRVVAVLETNDHYINKLIQTGKYKEDDKETVIGSNSAQVRELIQLYRSSDQFFYFSLSADPSGRGSYRMQSTELSSGDFMEEVGRALERPEALVFTFLDGDAVIRHGRGAEWVKALLDHGRAGLIAVETDITNPQLKYCGWRIARDIWLSDEPMISAIEAARDRHWPLSLLYGVYCDPSTARLDPPPEHIVELIDLYIEAAQKGEKK
ncbi:hypothetical protein AB6B38_09605 [Glycocaulis abyssi]|uniref:Uncharacterized protein n=1 Tax=Glycocaulis abyssi TaxID=1433403 RepID=A0ABV9NDA4_9PROT